LQSRHIEADFILCIKNPEAKLEELQRLSILELEHLKSEEPPQPPLRELPRHSIPTPDKALDGTPPYGTDGSSDVKPKPQEKSATASKPLFKEPDFEGAATTVTEEEILSPTQTQER
jgi:glycogenin glucosyltransferase